MSLEITYHAADPSIAIYGEPIASETRTASGTSAQSGAVPDSARVIRVKSTANNRYAYGADPTATATAGASGHYIASGDVIDLRAKPGHKIAVITAA